MSADADVQNGAAMAAFLGAAIGAFTMGLVVIVNEVGIYSAPSLYGPAGGVSGRTTIAAIAWLVAWGVLHRRWRNRQIEPARLYRTMLVLIVVSLVLTFPPLWKIVSGG